MVIEGVQDVDSHFLCRSPFCDVVDTCYVSPAAIRNKEIPVHLKVFKGRIIDGLLNKLGELDHLILRFEWQVLRKQEAGLALVAVLEHEQQRFDVSRSIRCIYPLRLLQNILGTRAFHCFCAGRLSARLMSGVKLRKKSVRSELRNVNPQGGVEEVSVWFDVVPIVQRATGPVQWKLLNRRD